MCYMCTIVGGGGGGQKKYSNTLNMHSSSAVIIAATHSHKKNAHKHAQLNAHICKELPVNSC